MYIGALLFGSGALGPLPLDSESIDDEQPALVIYGVEGILKLDDPKSICGYVHLIRDKAQEVEMPFTHGYTRSSLYGPETTVDYGRHRGVGATKMAGAMLAKRPHRASAEFDLHILELLCGQDRSSAEGIVYDISNTFIQRLPLHSGYTEMLFGDARANA